MFGSMLWSGAVSQSAKWQEPRAGSLQEPGYASQRRAEVAALLVRHDRAGIVCAVEILADDLVKRDSIRAGDLDGSIQRLRHGDFGKVSGEVVREDWLKQ